MIHIDSVSYAYGDVSVLSNVSATIESGEVTGLIGTNGAGKSTLIYNLIGILQPNSGEITVGDQDPDECQGRFGYVPEENVSYKSLNAEQFLQFSARLYGVPKKTAKSRYMSILSEMDFDDDAYDTSMENLSNGMKRKILIARSIIHDPDILIYDEPTGGLDYQTTQTVLKAITQMADDGKTVIFTSHNMENVQRVCDTVLFLHDGEIRTQKSIDHTAQTYYIQTQNKLEPPFAENVTETDTDCEYRVRGKETLQSFIATFPHDSNEISSLTNESNAVQEMFKSVGGDTNE